MENKTILITGASGAIGGALAKQYATSGVNLILLGRNVDLLANVAKECTTLGAVVKTVALDLRDTNAVRNWVANDLVINSLPDLVFANAGVSSNNSRGNGEKWEDIEAVLDVNIKSVFALLNDIILAMRKRGSGQIILISSLAAYYGLPNTPSYSASKAAIKTYSEALRVWLAPQIKVNVVMPGDIKSKMCDAMEGPVGFLMQPDKAALIIKRGVEKNVAKITFPFPVNFGAWLLTILPAKLSEIALNLMGYKLK
jgi:short-subunit dehydrogenase